MRRSSILFSLAVCFLLGLSAEEAGRKTEPMKTYNEGLLRLGQNKPDEAIAIYKKIIAADPTFWQAYGKLVLAYDQLHQLEAAQGYLEEVGAAQESNPYAYYGLGLVYQQKRDLHRAVAYYKKCIELGAESAGLHGRFAEAYRVLKKSEEAIAYLEERIKSNPENSYAHYGLGWIHYRQNAWPQGLHHLSRALTLKSDLIEAYGIRGNIYFYTGRYAEALQDFERMLELAEKANDLENKSQALNNMGGIYWRQASYERALQYYQKRLETSQALGDRRGEAGALVNMGNVYYDQGKYDSALEHFQKSLPLSQSLPGRELEEGAAYNGMGNVYTSQDKYGQALEYYQKGLLVSQALGNRRMEGTILNGMSVVYARQASYRQALESYQKSLVIFQQLGDPKSVGAVFDGMGNVYANLGKYGQALEYYQKSLTISQQLRNRRGEGQTLNNIGEAYRSQGNYAQALDYYRKSLTIIQQLGVRGEEQLIFNNMGIIYQSQGNYRQAMAYYQKSLAISQAVEDRSVEGRALANLGNVHYQRGNYRQALPYFEKSLAIFQQVGDRLGEAAATGFTGAIYTRLGEQARGIERLRLGLKMAEEINHAEQIWHSHARLADALERQRPPQTNEALVHYKLAAAAIRTTRSQWRRPEQKVGFFEDKIWVYKHLCNLLARLHRQPAGMGKGYDQEAFRYAEESRARALVELLEESKASINITEGADAELLEKERSLRAGLSEVHVRLEKEKRASELKELEKRRDTLYHEYEILIGELRGRNPLYAQLKYPEAVTVEQCRKLLDEDTALLEYLLGDERSLLFVVSRAGYRLITLPARAAIEGSVRKLLKTFTADATVNGQLQLIYTGEARGLYDRLVKPAEKLLKGKKKLLIAPDGALYYVPFTALLTKEVAVAGKVDFKSLPCLVKQYEISYIQSASVLSVLAEHRKEKPGRQKKFLAFADPAYEKKQEATKAVESQSAREDPPSNARGERSQGWQRLPYSGEEARRIAELYPKDQVTLFLGEDATEENLKKASLWEYERVHFAAHSIANESKPQFSGIILTTAEGSGEDGYLQMYEIFNLRLAARLVVLSGCESGLGKQTNGEGMVGLIRAFMYAGAESIVASLWKIEDRSTSEFMRAFYAGLEKSATAQALRSTQMAFIHRGHYSHPYFWAAFTLHGGP